MILKDMRPLTDAEMAYIRGVPIAARGFLIVDGIVYCPKHWTMPA